MGVPRATFRGVGGRRRLLKVTLHLAGVLEEGRPRRLVTCLVQTALQLLQLLPLHLDAREQTARRGTRRSLRLSLLLICAHVRGVRHLLGLHGGLRRLHDEATVMAEAAGVRLLAL